jgi:hypothetical protein
MWLFVVETLKGKRTSEGAGERDFVWDHGSFRGDVRVKL